VTVYFYNDSGPTLIRASSRLTHSLARSLIRASFLCYFRMSWRRASSSTACITRAAPTAGSGDSTGDGKLDIEVADRSDATMLFQNPNARRKFLRSVEFGKCKNGWLVCARRGAVALRPIVKTRSFQSRFDSGLLRQSDWRPGGGRKPKASPCRSIRVPSGLVRINPDEIAEKSGRRTRPGRIARPRFTQLYRLVVGAALTAPALAACVTVGRLPPPSSFFAFWLFFP
jgi:hypothetical protein